MPESWQSFDGFLGCVKWAQPRPGQAKMLQHVGMIPTSRLLGAALPSDGAKNEDVIFHKKITLFGVFYSELVGRAASHAACMAFESLWSTSPLTLPARLPTQAS